jgi:hypothetical protein
VVRAYGPDDRRRTSWSVSFEIFAPRSTDIRLETDNGGIEVDGMYGNVDFAAGDE